MIGADDAQLAGPGEAAASAAQGRLPHFATADVKGIADFLVARLSTPSQAATPARGATPYPGGQRPTDPLEPLRRLLPAAGHQRHDQQPAGL
ncbi:MAG: hypothetical protein U5J62_12140 [Desulfurivibrio sp.]|nr:hypothetical protein [Desulfurivibrio sp.]